MRVLITGGAGFIGSHLAEALLQQGHQVDVIDDLSTGSIRNIQHLKFDRKFTYIIEDVANKRVTAEFVDLADVVFHMAAAVGVKLIVESPVRTIETNLRTTEVILELCAKKRKRVLVASTSEVYGKSTSLPFREDGDLVMGSTLKGRWSYACSKAIDEFLAIAYNKERRLPTVVARLFNTVGPRQTGQYGMVVPTFVRQALEGRPITVYGDGKQRRCFAHVLDVADALIKLIQHDGAVGDVFNIGSQEEISILQLAETVKRLSGSPSKIEFIPYSEAYEEGFEDMERRVPDISKIGELIGYAPKRGLEQIITDVIAYYRSL